MVKVASAGNDLRSSSLYGQPLAKNQADKDVVSAANFAKFQNIGTMRTALQAVGYTAAQLDTMTANDMVYALKVKNNL